MARAHLGLILPNHGEALGAGRLGSAAAAAEKAGFDCGWVTYHLIVSPERAGVRTIANGLVSLGFLAARTCVDRIRQRRHDVGRGLESGRIGTRTSAYDGTDESTLERLRAGVPN